MVLSASNIKQLPLSSVQQGATMSVIVVGATGFFGAIISRLLSCPGVRDAARGAVSSQGGTGISQLILAARNESRCEELANALRPQAGEIDIREMGFDSTISEKDLKETIRKSSAQVLINAAGPYPTTPDGLKHPLATACIESGVHYIDLADSSTFVRAISALHDKAVAANVLAVSGCSTVPAISGAVIEELRQNLDVQPEDIESIDLGITPGWKSPRGIGTSRSILSTVGKPVKVLVDGKWTERRVWGDHHRRDFPPPLGQRWLANLDVPDLQLWPRKYSNVKSVRVYAGLELPLFHLGTGLLGVIMGRGDVNLGAWPIADILHNATERLDMLGTFNGGMYVTVKDFSGRAAVWNLAALDSSFDSEQHGNIMCDLLPPIEVGVNSLWPGQTQMRGPRIPCLPAVLLAHKLLSIRSDSPAGGKSLLTGAGPSTNYLKFSEIDALLKVLGIKTNTRILRSDRYKCY